MEDILQRRGGGVEERLQRRGGVEERGGRGWREVGGERRGGRGWRRGVGIEYINTKQTCTYRAYKHTSTLAQHTSTPATSTPAH